MAVTFNQSGLGFAKINSTTVHVTDVSYSPAMGTEPFRSGGDLTPSMIRRTGGMPVFRMTMPLASAWTALGSFGPVALTACEIYLATFTAGIRQTTGANIYRLDVGGVPAATGFACISRLYPGGGEIPVIMAEVTCYLASGNGVSDPVVTTTGSLPTAPAAPVLHALSTVVDNATGLWGLTSWAIEVGIGMEPVRADGLFYPTAYRFNQVAASASIAHRDAVAIYAALTGDGKLATGAGIILYARAYNSTTQLFDTTGYSFTFANCLASLESFSVSGTDVPSVGMTLTAYAAPGTTSLPITVATSATIPT